MFRDIIKKNQLFSTRNNYLGRNLQDFEPIVHLNYILLQFDCFFKRIFLLFLFSWACSQQSVL